jgi:hypothetical protein
MPLLDCGKTDEERRQLALVVPRILHGRDLSVVARQRRAHRCGIASDHHDDGLDAAVAEDPDDAVEKRFA